MAKRARERARQERKEAKRERRESSSEPTDTPDESQLMEEFHSLSERHAAGQVGEQHYLDERHRIFVELGIESDEDR